MPKRPWITPDDVLGYTDDDNVSCRSEDKLKIDISRAESYILAYTKNKNLLDDEKYPEVPEAVKTAVIILAEHYGISSIKKGITSESFDDYSYSVDSSVASLDNLDIGILLDDFIISEATGTVTMKAFIV